MQKGVNIDFNHLQLRDYNLNTLENVSEICGVRDQVIGDICESLGSRESISRTKSVEKPKSQTEIIMLPSLVGHPKVIKGGVSAVDGKLTSPAQKDNIANFQEQKISENVSPFVGSARSTTCTYCNRRVSRIL